MKDDHELDAWRLLWRSQPETAVNLIRKVERQTIYMRLGRVAEILVTVFIGGGTLVWAARSLELNPIVLAAGTWAFLLYAWSASLSSSRGMWAPGGPTVRSYLDLAIERQRRSIKAAWQMSLLMVLETLFGLIIGNKMLADMGSWRLSSFIFTTAVSIAISVGFVLIARAVRSRKLQPQLAYLLNLQRQLNDNP